MSDHVAVLFANEAFYVAFATGDADAMDEVWARQTPVTCIHPGWNLLAGREAVMSSWRNILGHPRTQGIRCVNPSAWLLGGMAYVTCHEAIDQAFLIATNVFVRENGAWKMVHHQAAAAPPPMEDEPEEPDTMQ
jgi:hypothetical protein